MTLTARIEDAKTTMQQELIESFVELKREAKVIDQLKTACQRSHRCWPSRLMTGALVVLLAVNWYLMSDRIHEDQARYATLEDEMRRWEAEMNTEVLAQVEALRVQVDTVSLLQEEQRRVRKWWSRRR